MTRRDVAAPSDPVAAAFSHLDGRAAGLADAFHALLDHTPALPLPGRGQTAARWRQLARIAARDLTLVKLYEAHADALAILDELGATAQLIAGRRWAVWAADPPQSRLQIDSAGQGGHIRLSGRKPWCSGATLVSHALVTVWRGADEGPYLAAVALDQPGITITDEGWVAVGMAATGSVDVLFDRVDAELVGGVRAYLDRPGFWAGALGIAACWQGAAAALGDRLLQRLVARDALLDAVSLGRVDVALSGASALLAAAATVIDHDLSACTMALALRARLAVEQAVETTLGEVGRALGAAPYCRDPWFARISADLPVFVRQSHADHDRASLGRQLIGLTPTWLP